MKITKLPTPGTVSKEYQPNFQRLDWDKVQTPDHFRAVMKYILAVVLHAPIDQEIIINVDTNSTVGKELKGCIHKNPPEEGSCESQNK